MFVVQVMESTQVVLVNAQDEETGLMGKLEAHRRGLLHRAFSVLVFNNAGEMLLQQRALHKYHSAGLWTNTCCSHPLPGEAVVTAAHRRLQQEMGLSCDLRFQFAFTYRAQLDNGLVEHELDHVFSGTCDLEPDINPDEVAAFRWVAMDVLRLEVQQRPERFTCWLPEILKRL